MTKAKEELKNSIEKITDEAVIEKVHIYIMGILTQQGLEKERVTSTTVSQKE